MWELDFYQNYDKSSNSEMSGMEYTRHNWSILESFGEGTCNHGKPPLLVRHRPVKYRRERPAVAVPTYLCTGVSHVRFCAIAEEI